MTHGSGLTALVVSISTMPIMVLRKRINPRPRQVNSRVLVCGAFS